MDGFYMENLIKMDDLGVPLFSETSTYEKIGKIRGLDVYFDMVRFMAEIRYGHYDVIMGFSKWKISGLLSKGHDNSSSRQEITRLQVEILTSNLEDHPDE